MHTHTLTPTRHHSLWQTDTEGAFSTERLGEMADALEAHLLATAGTREVTRESVLAGTHVLRPTGYVGLLAAVRALPQFLERLPRVRFVAIDSVAFPFEHSLADMALRTRLLCSLNQALVAVARSRNVAIALTNAVTTRIDTTLSSAHLVPALGESFGHNCAFRVRLFWANNVRYATLDKSHLPPPPPLSASTPSPTPSPLSSSSTVGVGGSRVVPFTIIAEGVRAVGV